MGLKHLGYARRVILDEELDEELMAMYGDKTLVVWSGPGLDGHTPQAVIGDLQLYLMGQHEVPPPGPQLVTAQPVLCARRGGLVLSTEDRVDGFVGIDDEVCTELPLLDLWQGAGGIPKHGEIPEPQVVAHEESLLVSALDLIGLTQANALLGPEHPTPRIAIIDESFSGLPDELPEGFEPPVFHGLPRPLSRYRGPTEVGHGTRMAATLQEALGPTVQLGLFRLVPTEADVHSSWLAPTDLALILAHAIQAWKADLVLIPMGDALWGTPRHLRAVLREAQRVGRGGRGVPILCAVGDSTKNHCRDGPVSYALGADELASQPQVLAVSSTDTAGRWYRRYNETFCAPINRFGPAVAFSAPGEMYRVTSIEERLVDDSSVASALATAATAVVLRQAPHLHVHELREILQRTADVPPLVDDGPGTAHEHFNAWDREGHNPKLGAGRVNALAAMLAAADPVCFALLLTRSCPSRLPARGVAESEPAIIRALAWYNWVQVHAVTPGDDLDAEGQRLLSGYLRVRGVMARRLLSSSRWRESLMWLARHLMALWDGDDTLLDSEGNRDHGALALRLEHALETLRDELVTPAFPADAEELLPWLDALRAELGRKGGRWLQRFIFGGGSAFDPVWRPGTPTGILLRAILTTRKPRVEVG
ncbi:S8 family serine peptidase [Corallococcus exiguus]|uniref:S8 family serine peptidase n=1 Tax=Corallococcus exiguus TaxID=83462 RepID=A0A7X4YFT8_9BACT|nr:S8 family serine peptidase [Corallococcus exiguus]NBC44559.1 S8 family serine peptidase [Corallococcus exiguus]TNV67194.1 S8/S53 family peptidase [Corallococcus exiguus]